MTIDQQSGTMNIRSQFIDGTINDFAKRAYKFKQAVTVDSTGAWKNYFFRESTTPLTSVTTTGMTSVLGKGIPRGAAIPQAVVEWERVNAVIVKNGLGDFIYWEDVIAGDVDVRDRTLKRIAEAVAKFVDDTIYDGLTQGRNQATYDITSWSIAVGSQWDQSGANPISDLLYCKQIIGEYNYDTGNLIAFINPKQSKLINAWIASKGAQFPTLGAQAATNGNIGRIAGVDFIESNSVPASQCLVVVPKVCATWKELVALSTNVEEKKFKGYKIEAVELGTLQLKEPHSVVLINNTN